MVLPTKNCEWAQGCPYGTTHVFSVPAGHCTKFTTSAAGGATPERYFDTDFPCVSAYRPQCLVVKGSATVNAITLSTAPAAWVRAETAEDWAGSPCPFSCN